MIDVYINTPELTPIPASHPGNIIYIMNNVYLKAEVNNKKKRVQRNIGTSSPLGSRHPWSLKQVVERLSNILTLQDLINVLIKRADLWYE